MRATCLRFGMLAYLGVLAAGALAAPAPEAPSAGSQGGLVVHEWGTFSSFSGADGVLLRFHPANTDLPEFVHRSALDIKSGYAGIVSLETPVLYFYADRPLTAAVAAQFPSGTFTEWYPHADHARSEKVLRWTDVRVRPDGAIRLPRTPGATHYYAAREAEAAPLEVAFAEGGKERREQEGFLFYRGVGNPKPPLEVTAQGNGSFSCRVSGEEPIAALLLIEVRPGAVRYRQLEALAPGAAVHTELPEARSTAEALRSALMATLMNAGLYEKEAHAMVKTWESAWFGEEGTRVLYVLPAGWTGRALPLQVTPRPDALVRVLVGRHDLLTPERERDLDRIVRELHGPSEAEQSAAAGALAKLGRFAAPARDRAEKRLAGSR